MAFTAIERQIDGCKTIMYCSNAFVLSYEIKTKHGKVIQCMKLVFLQMYILTGTNIVLLFICKVFPCGKLFYGLFQALLIDLHAKFSYPNLKEFSI